MKKLSVLIILIVAFVCSVFATGTNEIPVEVEKTPVIKNEVERAEKQELQLAFAATNLMSNFDFHHPWRDASLLYNLLYSTLLTADYQLEVAGPGIMKDYHVSDDGLKITMTLDPDYKWSDGTSISMEDIVWTLEMYCNKFNSWMWSYVVSAMKYVKGYTEYHNQEVDHVSGFIVEGDTLTIELTTPFTSFVSLLCQIAPLPKHIYGEIPPTNFETNEIWKEIDVVSGMYQVVEHVNGSYYVLEPNPYYNGEKPIIERIVGRVAQSSSVAAQSNVVDYFQTDSAEDYELMQTLQNFKMNEVPVMYYRFLGFNTKNADGIEKPFVKDPKVRQAFAYAIDWETLIGSLYGGQASFTQTGVVSSNKNYAGDWYEYNPTKAKELLDEAGFDYSHTIKILYYYADSVTRDVMDGIIYYLSQIGVKADAVYTSNTSVDVYTGRTQDITYWGLSAFDSLSWYQQYTRATSPMFFDNARLEEYKTEVQKLEVAFSPEKLKASLDTLQSMEKSDCFYIPVYTLNYQAWTNAKLQIPENSLGNDYFYHNCNFEDWFFAK